MASTVSIPWSRTTNPYVEDVEVVQEGDQSGVGMVLRFTLKGGREVGAIALPQHSHSRTGPTWSYLMDCQGWTLIDAGPRGAMDALEKGLGLLGRKLTDLERVIITHGHQDHDGNSYDLIKASGAELWAHELYFHFLSHEHMRTGLDKDSLLHQAIFDTTRREEAWYRSRANSSEHTHWRDHNDRYMTGQRNILEEKLPFHVIRDGDELAYLRFLYTPGHAVDELCIALDGAVVFTGDHILPQISPHPTFKRTYPEPVLDTIPAEYRDRGKHYGLACYLQSLGKVLELDHHTTVFPAHRLFNHDRMNLRDLRRAQEIIRHHLRRLEKIMESIGNDAITVGDVTVRTFPSRKLTGGGYFAAMSEMVSHLELLVDAGDIQVSAEGKVRRSGTDNFYRTVQALAANAPA